MGKVAIIDIDVHHGNGTEEIVQQFPHPNKLLFVSLHIFDKDGDFSFYPGSGEKDLLEDNVINVALKPLWRRNVRRSSRSSSSSSSRDCKCGRKEWVLQMQQRVIASLRAFNPDLILISAGFDACKDDVGNGKYQPNYTCGMDLNAEDYVAITQSVMQVADICCNGRVVSILEGGYGNHRRRSEPIDRSSLARVCAAHVCTLAGHTCDWKEPARTRTSQPKIAAKSPVASRLRNKPARSQSQESESESENTERTTTVPLLPEQDEEKETELYCTCHEPANSEEFMIECSSGIRCNGWVHPKCLGLSITEDDAADLDNFVCDWCQASAGPGMSVVSKGFGDRKTKLSKRKSTDGADARTPAKRKRIPSRKFLKSQRL